MKKRSYAARLGVLALALTLVTTCLTGGTLAKYTTEVTGTGKAVVAKWSFLVGNDTTAPTTSMSTLTLHPAKYDNVTDGKIAPGTTGYFIIHAKNDSDVAATYTATFSAQNVPTNLKFYQSTDGTTKGSEISKGGDDSYSICMDQALAIGAEETKYVMWEWPIGDTKESDQDTIATGSYEMSVSVKVTGTQATPTATPVP